MNPLLYCRPTHPNNRTELSFIVQRKKLLSDQCHPESFLSVALQSARLEACLKMNAAVEMLSLCLTPEWHGPKGRPRIHLCRECNIDAFQLIARPVDHDGHELQEQYVLLSLDAFLPFIRHVLMGGDDADRALLVHVFQQVSRMCRSLEQQVDVLGYRGPSFRRLTHLIREQLSECIGMNVIRIDLPDECEEMKREESPLRWLRQRPGRITSV